MIENVEFSEFARQGLKMLVPAPHRDSVVNAIESKIRLQDPWTFARRAEGFPAHQIWIWSFSVSLGKPVRVLFETRVDGVAVVHAASAAVKLS